MPPQDPRLLDVSDASAKGRVASMIGRTISGRYRVDELLAMGGMGAVYRGEHVLMKKRIAIKILHPEVDERRDLVKRFEREAIAGAHIQHVNVASATDFGKLDDGAYFLVLEYVRGKTLHEMLKERPIAMRRAVKIARQLAAALAAVHGKGILHRDLKPRNVIVDTEQDDLTKLIDFGLAKVNVERLSAVEEEGDRVTDVGTVFGTVAYMAPEAAHGMQAVEQRSDLYALGILLYEMLAGKHPFDGNNPIELFRQQRFDKPPSFAERSPDRAIPDVVESIVQRLLEKEPDARFQTAHLLGEAMDAALPAIEAFAPEPAEPSLNTAELRLADLAGTAPSSQPLARNTPPTPPNAPFASIAPSEAVAAVAPISEPPIDPPRDSPSPSAFVDAATVRVSDSSRPPAPHDPYAAGSHGGPSIRAPSMPPESLAPQPTRGGPWITAVIAGGLALAGGLAWFLFVRAPDHADGVANAPTTTASGSVEAARQIASVPVIASAPPIASAAPIASVTRPAPVVPVASAIEPPTTPASASAAATGPAPDTFDGVGWRAVLRRSAAKADWNNGQAALLGLVERAPEAFHEPLIIAAAREVATALGHAGGPGADRVFDALTYRVGSDGLDVLYDIVAERGGSIAAKRAEAILDRKDVIARATPELRIAFALRSAPCDGKLALLDRAVAVGDARALIVLQTFGVACFKRNKAIEDAMRQIRVRLQKH